jgi:hypothetical protein
MRKMGRHGRVRRLVLRSPWRRRKPWRRRRPSLPETIAANNALRGTWRAAVRLRSLAAAEPDLDPPLSPCLVAKQSSHRSARRRGTGRPPGPDLSIKVPIVLHDLEGCGPKTASNFARRAFCYGSAMNRRGVACDALVIEANIVLCWALAKTSASSVEPLQGGASASPSSFARPSHRLRDTLGTGRPPGPDQSSNGHPLERWKVQKYC